MKRERLSVLIERGVELGKWEMDQAKDAMDVAEAVGLFFPCEVVADVDDSTARVHAHYVRPMLVHELNIRVRNEGGMLSFIPEVQYPLAGNKQTPELTMPNRVGLNALSERKVRQWIDFIEQRAVILAERQGETEAKHAAFLEKLERSGEVIHWHHKGTKGHVEKGGLSFEFELYAGGVSTQIKLGYIDRDFETWQRMTRFANEQRPVVKRVEEFVI
jgi:hypothetical protein